MFPSLRAGCHGSVLRTLSKACFGDIIILNRSLLVQCTNILRHASLNLRVALKDSQGAFQKIYSCYNWHIGLWLFDFVAAHMIKSSIAWFFDQHYNFGSILLYEETIIVSTSLIYSHWCMLQACPSFLGNDFWLKTPILLKIKVV